jgi:hypothetical protein
MITLSFTVTPADNSKPTFTYTHKDDDMELIETFVHLLKHANSFSVSDLVITTEELA